MLDSQVPDPYALKRRWSGALDLDGDLIRNYRMVDGSTIPDLDLHILITAYCMTLDLVLASQGAALADRAYRYQAALQKDRKLVDRDAMRMWAFTVTQLVLQSMGLHTKDYDLALTDSHVESVDIDTLIHQLSEEVS